MVKSESTVNTSLFGCSSLILTIQASAMSIGVKIRDETAGKHQIKYSAGGQPNTVQHVRNFG